MTSLSLSLSLFLRLSPEAVQDGSARAALPLWPVTPDRDRLPFCFNARCERTDSRAG